MDHHTTFKAYINSELVPAFKEAVKAYHDSGSHDLEFKELYFNTEVTTMNGIHLKLFYSAVMHAMMEEDILRMYNRSVILDLGDGLGIYVSEVRDDEALLNSRLCHGDKIFKVEDTKAQIYFKLNFEYGTKKFTLQCSRTD